MLAGRARGEIDVQPEAKNGGQDSTREPDGEESAVARSTVPAAAP